MYRIIKKNVYLNLYHNLKRIDPINSISRLSTVASHSFGTSNYCFDRKLTKCSSEANHCCQRFFSNEINGRIELSQIDNVKVFQDQNIIQINFRETDTINFNLIWLRDSCQCPQCVHSVTRQKLLNCADIEPYLLVHRIKFNNDSVYIIWRNDSGDEHESVYSIDWIKMFSNIYGSNAINNMSNIKRNSLAFPKDSISSFRFPNDGIYAPMFALPSEVYWNSGIIENSDFKVKYKHLMDDTETLKRTVKLLLQLGIVFIEDVPIDENAILTVARRIAYERRTGYGVTFDVTYNPDPNTHLSYTGTKFDPHIDLAYRERSPGIQMLHCLEQASRGGQSMFVDAFMCADMLRKKSPECFDVLSKFPVLFSFCDSERGFWFREKWNIIYCENKVIKEIHYSDFSMRPPLLPLEHLNLFYRAYQDFTEIIRDNDVQFKFYMKPGDLVMFNNRRVLHGRGEYDHFKEKRFLKGCYMDMDEVKSLYENLNTN